MTVLWLKRVGNALFPDGDDSSAQFAKLPFGKSLRAEVKLPRNVRHHRLYWGLVHRIAAATGTEPEVISDLLKIETGHCVTIKSKRYGQLHLPQSISFAKMDQSQFRDFFESCVKIIYENWGIERADVLEVVSDLLAPKTEKHG